MNKAQAIRGMLLFFLGFFLQLHAENQSRIAQTKNKINKNMDAEIAHTRFLTAMCLYADWTGQKCGLLFQEYIPRAIQKMNHASFPKTTAAFSYQ